MTVRTGVVEVFEEMPRLAPEGGLGALRTERGNLPLEQVDVRTTVVGLTARTELAQTFRNPYDVPLEATYIFPLPDRAAVTRLRMQAAGRIVEGVVKERETARADYDQAIAEGRRASIAEEERPGVFTLRVGNIVPGEQVVVRTTLSGRLPYEDGQATFRFPLVVAPRYIPGAALPGEPVGDGTAADTAQVPDASRISAPVLLPGFPNPVRLSIEVAVDPAGLPLGALASSLHGVMVSRDGERHIVRLDPGARCDRDFVLRLGYGGQAAATSLVVARDAVAGTGADTAAAAAAEAGSAISEVSAESDLSPQAATSAPPVGTFLLTVLPPEPTGAVRPRDVVLVLDRSGSMGGWKMTAARRAAARIVDTLTAADHFAVLAFDHEVTTPPDLPEDALVPATDRHRFRAVQHLATIEARGGTEMAEPLRRAAGLLTPDAGADEYQGEGKDRDRDRVLILVTDGQVGNEDALLSALSASLPHLRVHTIGIDTAVNAGFLNRLAAAGGGRCELVESEDRLDEAMDAVHRRVGTPLVTGLRVTGSGGLQLDQDSITPSRLPDLFVGAPLVVAGRFTGGDASSEGVGGVTVSGTAADGSPWTRDVPAVVSDEADLASFWARGRIRDLEDRYASVVGGHEELEKTIVDTSVRFNVLSRFTAFVAVDTVVVAEGDTLKRVTQPVDLPAGWQAERDVASPVSMPMMPMMAMPAAPAAPAGAAPVSALGGDAMSLDVRSTKSVRTAAPKPPTPPWEQIDAAVAAGPGGYGFGGTGDQPRGAARKRVSFLSADELDAFATTWLARLDAVSGAEAGAEEQEAVLSELSAAIHQMVLRITIPFLAAATALIAALKESTNPADRLQAAATELKKLRKPPPRPFWKR
ncbi:MAG: VWA domain-containing protein [Catenulispora sp.]|nr:VWA domain-containing protein [Catenulispora sp.]